MRWSVRGLNTTTGLTVTAADCQNVTHSLYLGRLKAQSGSSKTPLTEDGLTHNDDNVRNNRKCPENTEN
ncbi:hypothetical protein E2C01_049811 [Portunus trituberculatus]|uniref:Uncharacterized protein n=1 Tax=Portunus trituberculatus TaxID=210409 RepID=A0A5B7GE52_PORTR|nr:hypothetical protein [Portunus trituberculatus]